MKTRMLMVFIALLAIVPIQTVCAQDVEGVDINQKMTEAQIFEKFGEPDKVESKVDDVGVVTMMYYYGVNEVFFTDGFLTEFLIKDDHFKVLKTKISGGVTVGDMLSKVSPLKPELADWMKDPELYYVTIVEFNVFFRVQNDKIVKIWYSEPS